MNHTLTTGQKQNLYRDGYLVLKQVIPKEMIGRYEFPVFADEVEDAEQRA